MNCPNCSATVTAGQKFCAVCGTRLAAACASCGANLPEGAAFCPNCGTPVTRAEARGAAAQPPPLQQPAVAERRLVSVLFCDLVGFTTASERRDAEETRDLLAAYYELCRERVARYGGTIEKFVGDAVMAAWGVPTAHEDDAERAVRAALEIVAQVPAVLPSVQARAAVMSGEAAVTIGAEGQGMVAGDLVNTAARLQSVAEPGAVLAGEATVRAAERGIAFQEIGEQQLRGKDAPTRAWQALRIVAGVGGRLVQDELEPPFVGRDLELRLLDELFRATHREKRLRLVSITGQAGIGKSRLAREFEKLIDGQVEDVWWHQGRCLPYGEGVTFWALAEMVRRRTRIAETDDSQTANARLREALDRFVHDSGERERIGHALRTLLGLEVAGQGAREQGELFVLWRTFFERVAGDQSAVMVFEDVQWADDGLLSFIEHLLDFSRTRPIFVITLARPELLENRPTWGAGQRNFSSLHLERLSDEAMGELLQGLIPGLPPPARAAITRRAEGVPLYAVEIVRMLLADGTLERDRNVFRLTRPLRAPAVPETLRGLLTARLDSARPQERQLLQDASVLGQAFTVEALAAVSGQEGAALQPELAELVRREFLRLETDPVSPERGQYRFVQELVREVAHATLSKRDRRARHLAAARHFEQLGDESLAAVLAEHYLEAWRSTSAGAEQDALAAQARVALRAAAERALRLFAYSQAAALYERSLEVAPGLAEQQEIHERVGDALSDGLIGLERAQEHFRRALAISTERGSESSLRLVAKLGAALLNDLRVAPALEVLEPAWQEAGGVVDEPAKIMLAGQLARAYMLSGRPAEAVRLSDAAIEAADRAEMDTEMVEAMITRGTARALSGWIDGTAMLYGALELARRSDLPSSQLRAINNLIVWLQDYDPAAVAPLAEVAIEVSRRTGRQEINWMGVIAHAAANRGQLAPAQQILDDQMELIGEASMLAQNIHELLIVVAVSGKWERVRELQGQERELLEQLSSRDQQSNTAAVNSVVSLLQGSYEEAWALASAAPTDIASDFRAHGWAGVAALLLRIPERVQAALGVLELEKGRTPLVRKAQRLTLEAGLAGLTGRAREALEKARDATAAWAQTGEYVEGSIARVAMLSTMDLSQPELAEMERELRQRWSEWDAPGFSAYLERTLGSAQSGAAEVVAEAGSAVPTEVAAMKEE